MGKDRVAIEIVEEYINEHPEYQIDGEAIFGRIWECEISADKRWVFRNSNGLYDVTYISEGDEFTLQVYKRQDTKVRRILLG